MLNMFRVVEHVERNTQSRDYPSYPTLLFDKSSISYNNDAVDKACVVA